MEVQIERYKEWFDKVSERHGVEWAINQVNWEELLLSYRHVVAINGEDERVFSSITIPQMEMHHYVPEGLAEENFKQHHRLIGDVICNAIPGPFRAFIKPGL